MRRKHGNADICIVWADLAMPTETRLQAAERMVRDMFDGQRQIGTMVGDLFTIKDGVKTYRIEFTPRAADGRDVWTVYETHQRTPTVKT